LSDIISNKINELSSSISELHNQIHHLTKRLDYLVNSSNLIAHSSNLIDTSNPIQNSNQNLLIGRPNMLPSPTSFSSNQNFSNTPSNQSPMKIFSPNYPAIPISNSNMNPNIMNSNMNSNINANMNSNMNVQSNSNVNPPSQYVHSSSSNYTTNSTAAALTNIKQQAMSNQEHSITKLHKNSKPILYRNLFHTLTCTFNANADLVEYEGCRVYVDDNVGYSGNAKRFKKKPEGEERALIVNCDVTDQNEKPISQCLACKDYFENQKYFKASPSSLGKTILVKNNAPIQVENQQFKVLIKMMCCCVHQSADYFLLNISVRDVSNDRLVCSCKIPIYVKQWRKSTQKKEDYSFVLSTS